MEAISQAWIYILISEAVSLCLILKLIKRSDHVIYKLVQGIVTLTPFLGPFFYIFATLDVPPQHPNLQNRWGRGEYTHRLISQKAERHSREPENTHSSDNK